MRVVMMMRVLPVLPGFLPVPVLMPVPKYLHKILEKGFRDWN
jgi:hypothetical protein